jgi:hypothetical protein
MAVLLFGAKSRLGKNFDLKDMKLHKNFIIMITVVMTLISSVICGTETGWDLRTLPVNLFMAIIISAVFALIVDVFFLYMEGNDLSRKDLKAAWRALRSLGRWLKTHWRKIFKVVGIALLGFVGITVALAIMMVQISFLVELGAFQVLGYTIVGLAGLFMIMVLFSLFTGGLPSREEVERMEIEGYN